MLSGWLSNLRSPYSMGNMSSEQPAICSICSKSSQGKKLSCDHAFHGSCIDAWLRDRSNCPICRRAFSGAEDTTSADGKECPICLEYIVGLRMLPCGHRFHVSCISGRSRCPECSATFQEIVVPKCDLCSEELVSEDVKLPCGHSFHESCVSTWVKENNSCPECSSTIDPGRPSRRPEECAICLKKILTKAKILLCSHKSHESCSVSGGVEMCLECLSFCRTLEELRLPPLCLFCTKRLTGESLTLPCGHKFHKQCSSAWLEEQKVCPDCLAPYKPPQAADVPAASTSPSASTSLDVSTRPSASTSTDVATRPSASTCPDVATRPSTMLPSIFTTRPSASTSPSASASPDEMTSLDVSTSLDVTTRPSASASPDVATRPSASTCPDAATRPSMLILPTFARRPSASTSPSVTIRPSTSASPDVSTSLDVTTRPSASASPDETTRSSALTRALPAQLSEPKPPRRRLRPTVHLPSAEEMLCPVSKEHNRTSPRNVIQCPPCKSTSNPSVIRSPIIIGSPTQNPKNRPNSANPISPSSNTTSPQENSTHYPLRRVLLPTPFSEIPQYSVMNLSSNMYPTSYVGRQVYNTPNQLIGTPLYARASNSPPWSSIFPEANDRPSWRTVFPSIDPRPKQTTPLSFGKLGSHLVHKTTKEATSDKHQASSSIDPVESTSVLNPCPNGSPQNEGEEADQKLSRRSRTINNPAIRSKSTQRNRLNLSLAENGTTNENESSESPKSNLSRNKSSSRSLTNLNSGKLNVKRTSRRRSPSESCSFCCNDLEEKRITLSCDHKFHESCILPSLKEDKPCPVCGEASLSDDENEALRKQIEDLKLRDKMREKRLEQLEEVHRKKNLIFKGLRTYGPNSYSEVICHFCSEVLGVNVEDLIEAVVPIGQKRPDKQTLKVVFNSGQSAAEVLSKCSRLRGTEFSVSRDYSKSVRLRRNKLLHCRYEIMQKTELKCVFVRDEVLIVDNRKFVWDENEGLVAKEDKKDEAFLRKLIGNESWTHLKTFCKT